LFLLHFNVTRQYPGIFYVTNIPLQPQFLIINIHWFTVFKQTFPGVFPYRKQILDLLTECSFQHFKLRVLQISANGNEPFACTISSPSKPPAETLRTKRLPRPSTNEELPIFKVQKFLEDAEELKRY